MKKLLILLGLFISLITNAQAPPGYTNISARYDWLAGKFRALHVPAFSTTPSLTSGQWIGSGAVGIDSVLHRFYFYSGGSWRRLAAFSEVTSTTPPVYGIVSGGIVTWLHDLVYNVSPATYYINGTLYSSPSTDITLTAADPSDDRIDVVVVNTSSQVAVVEGTPDSPGSAVEPSIDVSTQFKLGFIIVYAGTTEPPAVTQDIIYQENLGTPTEWAATGSSGFSVNSTNNPYQGSKDIEATSIVNGNNVTLVRVSSTTLTSFNTLTFHIRIKTIWNNNQRLAIEFLNGATLVGSVAFGPTSYGLNALNISDYQTISIPLSDFGTGTVDRIRFRKAGSGTLAGFYLDDIRLQGAVTPPPTNQNFVSTIFRTPGVDSIYFKIGGVTFAIKDSTGEASTPNLQQVLTAGNTANALNVDLTAGHILSDFYSVWPTFSGSRYTSFDVAEFGASGNGVTARGEITLREQSDGTGNTITLAPLDMASDITIFFPYHSDGDTLATLADVRAGGGGVIDGDSIKSKGITIEFPGSAESFGMWKTPVAITVSDVQSVLVGSSTPSVTFNIAFGSDRTSGTNVFSSGQTVTSTTTGLNSSSGFNDATIPAGSFIWVTTSAQSGTVTQIEITINYTED